MQFSTDTSNRMGIYTITIIIFFVLFMCRFNNRLIGFFSFNSNNTVLSRIWNHLKKNNTEEWKTWCFFATFCLFQFRSHCCNAFYTFLLFDQLFSMIGIMTFCYWCNNMHMNVPMNCMYTLLVWKNRSNRNLFYFEGNSSIFQICFYCSNNEHAQYINSSKHHY